MKKILLAPMLAVWLGFFPAAGAARAEEEAFSCGSRGSDPVTSMERAARRLALEADLDQGSITHCRYSLRLACLEWEGGPPGAAWPAFERAVRLCDTGAAAWRGKVASRLDREDYAGAYADWKEGAARGGPDSAALAPYGRAVFAGLSLTDFPARGPTEWRLPTPAKDPQKAFLLSAIPGAGFLYAGEPGLAARHLVLGAGLTALVAWRLHAGFAGPDHDARMAAFLDAGVVALFLWKRYQLGGMREARRLLREKNRRAGGAQVRTLWKDEEPFKDGGAAQ